MPRIMVVTAGLAGKRNPVALALQDVYGAEVLPGKAWAEHKLDRLWRRLGIAEKIGKHAANIKEINRNIIHRAGSFDVLFLIKGNFVTAATLKQLKSLASPPKIIGWSPDDIYLPHNNSAILKAAAPFYDIFYTAKSLNIKQGELASMGFSDPRFIHQGFDRDWHRPLTNPSSQFFGLATFVGSGEQDRFDQLNYLARHGIDIHIWGNGWTSAMRSKADERLVIHGHPLHEDDYTDALSNSAISFCFLRKLNRDLHTSRTFEIPACGGFMIAERTEEHLDYFSEDEEAVYFTDQNELLTKVRYYLANAEERVRIASAGRQRCIKDDYSYHKLVKKMIRSAC